jgi:hypothetical protein
VKFAVVVLEYLVRLAVPAVDAHAISLPPGVMWRHSALAQGGLTLLLFAAKNSSPR